MANFSEFTRIHPMRIQVAFVGCGVLWFVTGCDNSAMFEPKSSEQAAVVSAPVESVNPADAAAPGTISPGTVNPQAVGGAQGADVAQGADIGQGAGIAQKAGVGVGVRGDSLRNEEGIGKMIAAPAVAYFNVREKAVFEIQIPHALNLYKALEGKLPKSHDEFMAKIVRANAIQLPELKPGMQYRYRPDQGELGELWVEPIQQ